MTYVWRAPATAIAVLLSAMYLIIEFVDDVDVVTILSAVLAILRDLEPYQVDNMLVVLVLIAGGLIVDMVISTRRQTRALEIQEQRLHVFKATMRTVQDLVNNCLNNSHSIGFSGRGYYRSSKAA
jgi:hypothetical protein